MLSLRRSAHGSSTIFFSLSHPASPLSAHPGESPSRLTHRGIDPRHPSASARPVSPSRASGRWRCPPPFPAGPGGHPRVYTEESLLLIALLRTLWRLSYQDMYDWLCSWAALALACGLPRNAQGLPRVPSPSQQWKRGQTAGSPVGEALLIVAVQT